MPDADELEGARRLALLASAKLSQYGTSTSSADLPPLLSCCFQLLRRLDHADPDLAARCAARLRTFIHTILSRDPDPSLVPALEVLFENLVDNNQLRRSYNVIGVDATRKGSRISAMAKQCQYELRARLELMSHHFISSELEFEQLFSWSEMGTPRIPELGFAAAMSLVRRSYLFSMPVIAQAHFVLLASRCAANGDLDQHLQAFQHTMSAYLTHLPALGVFDRTNAVKAPFSCYANMRLSSSPIPDTTNQKLDFQINRLLSCCKVHSDDGLQVKQMDVFDTCVSFIEENQHMFPEQLRQEAVIVVKRIVSKSLGCVKQETHGLDAKVLEEVIYLAAVLRLMGSSFLEILNRLRKMRAEDDMQHENSIVLCISETVRLLGQYEANGLNRHDLFGMSEKPVDMERPSALMLFHFANLLVFCFRMRFDFLWKGCIIMMMMAMNLMIDEERSLSAFQFLIASEDSATSSIHQEDSLKGSVPRKSSTSIASQFNNLRELRVRGDISVATTQRCKSGDGTAFFESIPGYKQKSSEWVDLVDFIDCKEDVDYSSWWQRQWKYREYKDAKWKSSKRDDISKKREYCESKTKRQKTSR